jgi:hypothetical protein
MSSEHTRGESSSPARLLTGRSESELCLIADRYNACHANSDANAAAIADLERRGPRANDWFEVGAYLPVYTRTREGRLLFDGVKLLALFVTPYAAERHFFSGLNFELSYNSAHWESSRYSAEVKPILGAHIGRIALIVNPMLDWSFDGLRNLDFAPAIRAAFTLNRRWTDDVVIKLMLNHDL